MDFLSFLSLPYRIKAKNSSIFDPINVKVGYESRSEWKSKWLTWNLAFLFVIQDHMSNVLGPKKSK